MSMQIHVQVNQAGPSASEGFIGDHEITMDLPGPGAGLLLVQWVKRYC